MINHIMVDLETLDTAPTAAMLSIGAIVFKGPQAGATFYAVVDTYSAMAAGCTASASTMGWWEKQSPQARRVFDDPGRMTLHAALQEFAHFVPPDARVWGNGASFDNAVLAHAYGRCSMALPWAYWNDRCYRTVAARIPARRQQKGTHHNALDDAISQADHLMAYAPECVV